LGLSAQQVLNKKNNIKKAILSKLCFKYSQCWKKKLFNDNCKDPDQKNKLRIYHLFKPNIRFEPYLNMENFHSKNVLTKFRVGVHHLEVEKGRHLKIKYSDRKCKLCNEEVEEEVHILIRCKKLELVRKKSISKIKDKYKALANCNSEELFIWLLSNENKEILIEISACIENLMTARAEMLQNI
jgi:hypothetical protein